MSVFVLYEVDFAHPSVVKIFDSIDKARISQVEKENSNTYDWIKYRIEEWDVE